MGSRLELSTLLQLTLLVAAVGPGIAQEIDLSTPGVYLLVEVNGKSLPSVSWARTSEGRHCETETLEGAILLDSNGRWAALVTEREACTDRDGFRAVGEAASAILIGSFEISGSQITVHDETLGGSDTGSLAGGVLAISVVAESELDRQTSEWVFHKAN